jgi:hypothetical protein
MPRKSSPPKGSSQVAVPRLDPYIIDGWIRFWWNTNQLSSVYLGRIPTQIRDYIKQDVETEVNGLYLYYGFTPVGRSISIETHVSGITRTKRVEDPRNRVTGLIHVKVEGWAISKDQVLEDFETACRSIARRACGDCVIEVL